LFISYLSERQSLNDKQISCLTNHVLYVCIYDRKKYVDYILESLGERGFTSKQRKKVIYGRESTEKGENN